MKKIALTLGCVAALSGGAGCIGDVDDLEDLETIASDLTDISTHTRSSFDPGMELVLPAIGVDDHTCFLTGVGGQLVSPTSHDGIAGPAITNVPSYPTQHWGIWGYNPTGGALRVTSHCAKAVYDWSTQDNFASHGALEIEAFADMAPGRVCFLTRIYPFSLNGYTATDHSVMVFRAFGKWWSSAQGDGVQANAACATVAEILGEWQDFAPAGTSKVVPLIPYTPGAICYLTGVRGRLNNATDIYQGPFVSFNLTLNRWELKLKNGTGGRVMCVR